MYFYIGLGSCVFVISELPSGYMLGAGAVAEGLMVELIHWLLKWQASFLSTAPPCGHKSRFGRLSMTNFPTALGIMTQENFPLLLLSPHFYSCTITVILGKVTFDQLPQDFQPSLILSEDGLPLHNAIENYLSNPGIEPRSPSQQLDSSPSEPPGKPIL